MIPDVDNIDASTIELIRQSFIDRHQSLYGHAGYEIELVNIQITGSNLNDKSLPTYESLELPSLTTSNTNEAHKSDIIFGRETYSTPTHSRDNIGTDHSLHGPLLITQLDATSIVLPGWDLFTDNYQNLLLQRISD